MKKKITCADIERAVVLRFYNIRQSGVVPRVSWGLLHYEADLLVMTSSGWCTEIEIKTTVADTKKDLEKRHGHYSDLIKYLWFALPERILDKAIAYIPERAGIYKVSWAAPIDGGYWSDVPARWEADIVREPQKNASARALTETEQKQFYRLGMMRYWSLRFDRQSLT